MVDAVEDAPAGSVEEEAPAGSAAEEVPAGSEEVGSAEEAGSAEVEGSPEDVGFDGGCPFIGYSAGKESLVPEEVLGGKAL